MSRMVRRREADAHGHSGLPTASRSDHSPHQTTTDRTGPVPTAGGPVRCVTPVPLSDPPARSHPRTGTEDCPRLQEAMPACASRIDRESPHERPPRSWRVWLPCGCSRCWPDRPPRPARRSATRSSTRGSGSPSTTFSLQVTYTDDLSGRHWAPDWVRVRIHGVTHRMSRAGDRDWSDGITYRWSGTLPLGTNDVAFEARSDRHVMVSLPAGTIVVAVPATPTPTPKPTADARPRSRHPGRRPSRHPGHRPSSRARSGRRPRPHHPDPTPRPRPVQLVQPSPTATPAARRRPHAHRRDRWRRHHAGRHAPAVDPRRADADPGRQPVRRPAIARGPAGR